MTILIRYALTEATLESVIDDKNCPWLSRLRYW